MEILRKHDPVPGMFIRRGFLSCTGATLLGAALSPTFLRTLTR